MKHKRRHARQVSSTDSESEESDFQSQQQSFSSECSQSSQPPKLRRLTKKQLKKLIQLQKAIEKQERILQKIKSRKAAKSSHAKQYIKKQADYKKQRTSSIKNVPLQQKQEKESRKLFITGIDNTRTYEQVSKQLNEVLKDLEGANGFRIKMKEGCPTYAFIDFQTKQNAKIAMDRLRKIRAIFGDKVAIYYSQDEQKQYSQKVKKCFECNQIGHFARQCQLKKTKDVTPQHPQTMKQTRQSRSVKLQNFQHEFEAEMPQTLIKLESQAAQKLTLNTKRIVRDKSRVNRIFNQS